MDLKISTIIRWALTAILLVFVYPETGWATTLTLTLVAIGFELQGIEREQLNAQWLWWRD